MHRIHDRNQHTMDNAGMDTIVEGMEKYLKFQCSLCKKIFACKTQLDMHMNIHTGAKPFICEDPGCGARFSHSSNLSRHMKTVHMKPWSRSAIKPP